MEQENNNESDMIYFTQSEALAVCQNYQWLIYNGFKFDTPLYGNLTIDKVLPKLHGNGKYTPMIIHDIFTTPEIPEFYQFKCPANYLLPYLKHKKIPYFRFRSLPFSI